MKMGKFKFSKKSGIGLALAVIVLITVIIVVQLSQNNDKVGKSNNNSIERMSAESRAESVKRFQTQFCGLDSKAQNNEYVTEVVLSSECAMPVGIYVDNDDNNNNQKRIWFVSTKNGTLYSYSTNQMSIRVVII